MRLIKRQSFTGNRLTNFGFGSAGVSGSGPAPSVPLWSFSPELGDPSNLSNNLSLNGSTVTPTALYIGDGAGGFTALAGPTLTTNGTGSAPENTLYHPFASDVATLHTGEAHNGGASSFGNYDYLFAEAVVFCEPDVGNDVIFVGENYSPPKADIALYVTSGGVPAVYVADGTNATFLGGSNQFEWSSWTHMFAVVEKTTGITCLYVNGEEFTSTGSAIGDLSTAEIQFGRYAGGPSTAIAYLGYWESSANVGGQPEWREMVSARFATISGFYATSTPTPTNDPDLLPSTITLNGNDAAAAAFYVGDGAGDFTAKVGSALSLIGTGSNPTNTTEHAFSSDYATEFGRTDRAYSGDTGFLGAERFIIIESIFRLDTRSHAVQNIIGADITPVNYASIYATTGNIVARIHDGSSSSDAYGAYAGIGWCHVFVVFDRNGTSRGFYLNGDDVTVTAGSAPSAVGSLSNYTLGVGSRSDYGDNLDGAIALVAFWASNLDLGVSADWAALAKSRYKIAFGERSQWQHLVSSRASERCLEVTGSDSATRFIQVGRDWCGIDNKTRSGTAYTSYNAGIASSSSVEYPTDCSQTPDWTHVNLTSASVSSSILSPVNMTYANELIADATSGDHRISFDGIGGPSNHAMACIVAPGDKTWMKFQTTGGTGATVYFNLSGSGSTGTTVGSATNFGIIPLGTISGVPWYYCYLYYGIGVPAAHDHYIQPVAGDGSDTFAGDGSTVDLYFAAAQHESARAEGYPTSLMINDSTGSLRSAESNSLELYGVSGSSHSVVLDFEIEDINDMIVRQTLYDISVGDTSEEIKLSLASTNDRLEGVQRAESTTQDTLTVDSVGVSGGGGEITFENSSGSLSVSATEGSDTGTAATSPNDPTVITLGASVSDIEQATYVDIKKLEVFDS